MKIVVDMQVKMKDNVTGGNQMNEKVTQKELQEKLRKTAKTIWRWKKNGLPVLDGNLYDVEEVEAWLRRKREEKNANE